MNKKLTIGLIGFGCVGSGLYEVLHQSKLIDATIKRIVVKDRNKKRSLSLSHFSFDVNDVLNDNEINVVVELINDSNEAFLIVKRALELGKDVVSANKKLIAERLPELLEIANKTGASFLYEGAVAGAIPILRNLEEYYNNDSLTSVEGIVNGTTNYILTQSNFGVSYDDALKKAQELGFAELDPTLDVDGFDAKFKLTILLKHAFGLSVTPDAIFNCGIRTISQNAVDFAQEKGLRIKLFAKAVKLEDKVVAFVAPFFVESNHFAFDVNNEFNAVIVEGLFADKQLFLGKGAGSYPTASAVLSDVSALKFGYRYEYKKATGDHELSLTNDVLVRIYLGAAELDELSLLDFQKVDGTFISESYSYRTGWVKFSELKKIDFNNRQELSVVFLSDDFLLVDDSNVLVEETRSFSQIEES